MTELPDDRIQSIWQIVEFWAIRSPEHPALFDVHSGTGLSYSQLFARIESIADQLHAAGVRSDDRVCTMFPNGLDAALVFMAVSTIAQCVPINPAGVASDTARQLDLIGPVLLIVSDALKSMSLTEAGEPGVPVAILDSPSQRLSDLPELNHVSLDKRGAPIRSGAEDIAVIVQTSGSTAAPKLVPLKHRQTLANARTFAKTLELTAEDRCLNVMQMHHVGGLQGTLLATTVSGGTTICTPGFSASEFSSWLNDTRPTWFEAVPTMLNALVSELKSSRQKPRQSPLRMVRSSSAALSPALLSEIEQVYGVPVIEAYGMSEAGIMAVNPLDPTKRRPGSVGRIVNDSIRIVSPDLQLVEVGQVGEIAASGPFMIESYASGGDTSPESFSNGMFLTGDLGYVDKDGFLTLVGRSKEMVNRGGESIGLREIDEVLEQHPDVEIAAAFGVPHPQLGEEILAAAVPTKGANPDSADLRRFLAELLPWSKVPKRIFSVEALPLNSTGKILRRELTAAHETYFTDGK